MRRAAATLAAFHGVAGGAAAQSTADLLKELQELKKRVAELEAKQKAPEAKPAAGQWGMTPEQAAEFNRIAVKTEAMEDARDASGLKLLKISGYMDPTFIYNKKQNRAGFQFLNAVGDDGYNYDNSYFGAAVLDFTKETDSGTRWRLTLAPNRGVGAVFDGNSPIHEASVSVPLTDLQTRFIAGQIPDWSGYEYLQPTLNKLITHNLLFDFTLPTAYTGAGMEITSGKWIVKGLLANLNTSKKSSGNKAPVFTYRVDYSRGEFQGFGFAGVHGKAANFRADDGVGNPVSGLPYDYIVRQLQDFKAGHRTTSDARKTNTGLMESFAKSLTDAEMHEAAAYFSSMPSTQWITVKESASVPKTRTRRPYRRVVSTAPSIPAVA